MLSHLQERKMTRLFTLFDADKNGVIEQEDYEAMIQNFAQIRGWEKESADYKLLYNSFMRLWHQMVQGLDKNNDNQVTLEEFLGDRDQVLHDPSRYETRIKVGQLLFAILDRDGDRQGTVEELKLFYRGLRIDETLAEEIFPKLDLNGDGYISEEEFLQMGYDFHYSNDPDAAGNWLFGPF